MGWYEALKDAIETAQKIGNLSTVRELIDAQKQILDLVDENHRLKKQLEELLEIVDISKKIERHEDAYLTLADDPSKRIYCSCCWDTKRILVQGQKTGPGTYLCPSCGTSGFYDKRAHDRQQMEILETLNSPALSKFKKTDHS